MSSPIRRIAVVLAVAVPAVLAGALGVAPLVDAAWNGPMVARASVAAERTGDVTVVDAAPPAPPPPTTPSPAAEVVRLANEARARAGVAPLTIHPAATAAAAAHSRDQASMGRMTHTGSDGSNAGERLERAGFAWGAWGENVAAGYPTAASVFDGWMGSPGHRANILSSMFTFIGVGLAEDADGRPYWTMVLAA